MNAFTLIFLAIFGGGVVSALLGKVKNKGTLGGSMTMLMIAGILYYAVAPILLIPIPLPLPLIVRSIGYVFLLIGVKRLILSLLD